MTITVPEPVLDRASTLPDQAIEFGEHARRILRMQALDPEFLVVAHLPRRVRHDGIQILTDESTGIIARYLCRVDDGRARSDKCFEIVHKRHALAERLLRLLAIRNVGPGAYDLRGASLVIMNDPEGVLHPDVMPITMAEAVLDRATAPFHQWTHFLNTRRASSGCRRMVQKSLSSSISHAENPMIRDTFSLTNVHT